MTDRRQQILDRARTISNEMGDDRFFTRKEVNCLPDVLAHDETLLALSSGMLNNSTWLIVLTDRRILLLDKGMFFGLKQTSISLDKVNSIQGRTGILWGKIIVRDSETAYEIDQVAKKTVGLFVLRTEEAQNRRRNGAGAGTSGEDRLEKLERLSALLRSGALDQQEFDAEKRRLLGS